jgi:hypothetical protein
MATRPTRFQYGNSAEYLAARIKRDRPDIVEAVMRGEFKSMRAAAIAAGIYDRKNIVDQLVGLWRKCNPAEQRQFVSERYEEDLKTAINAVLNVRTWRAYAARRDPQLKADMPLLAERVKQLYSEAERECAATIFAATQIREEEENPDIVRVN